MATTIPCVMYMTPEGEIRLGTPEEAGDNPGLELELQIASAVVADAGYQLENAMARRNHVRIEEAIKQIVEASLPERRLMPEFRNDTVYRGTGGPHVAWKWVSATGMLTLLVRAPLNDWGRLVVSTFITYPGLSKRPKLLFSDQTDNPADLPLLVQMAVKHSM